MGLEKISRPNSASTMSGIPASISIADSVARASEKGRPYSLSHTAITTPSGKAIAVPSIAMTTVPINGSKKPPVWLSENPAVGLVTSSDGERYLMPWTSMKITIDAAIAQKRIPKNQQKASPSRSVRRNVALDSIALLRIGRDVGPVDVSAGYYQHRKA